MIYNKYIICLICSIFAILWHFCNIPFWTSVGYTSTSVLVLWSCFNYIFWRIWPNVFGRKNISGKWKGKIKSSFNSSTSKSVSVTIKQSFSNTRITAQTNEIISKSVVVVWDNKNNTLYYIYKTDPGIKVKNKNPVQDGAAKIVFDKKANKNNLTIEYWTDRKTIGCMKLKKISWFRVLCSKIKKRVRSID